MQTLKALNNLRVRNFQSFLQPGFGKKTNLADMCTSQARRFRDSQQCINQELTKCDQLFLKWEAHILKDLELCDGLFAFLEREFRLLYTSYERHRPSLVAYTQDIVQILKQNKVVCLKQTMGRSQLFQLAVGLALEGTIDNKEARVILYTCKEMQRHYEYFYLEPELQNGINAHDNSSLRLQFSQIPNLEIRYFQDPHLPSDKDAERLVIFDLFTSSRSLFGPQFDVVMSSKSYKNVIVYSQNDTDFMDDQRVEIDSRFPIEVQKETHLKQRLLSMLEQGKNYAQNQDIIILTPTPQLSKIQVLDIIRNHELNTRVVTGEQDYDPKISHIFIARGERDLAKWNYNYDNVIALFDYGVQASVYFDARQRVFLQAYREINQSQMEVRLGFVGHLKPAKYFQMFGFRPKQKQMYCEQELNVYTLSMIALGNSIDQILKDKPHQIKSHLEKILALFGELGIVSIQSNQGKIITQGIQHFGVPPIFAKVMLELKTPAQSSILTYIVGLLMTPGTLKKTQNKSVHQIWKKEGELFSLVQIMYVYQQQTLRKLKGQQQTLRKKSSREEQLEVFGNLFTEWNPSPRLALSEMSLAEIVSQLDIDQRFANECMQNVTRIRGFFKLEFVEFENIDDQIASVVDQVFKTIGIVALYTGSRRFGYKMQNSGSYYQPSKDSLLSIFNERHRILLPLRLRENIGKPREILLSTRISDQSYFDIIGDLPIMNQKSSFSDLEVEFIGMSNAMLQAIWNTDFVEKFERKYKCMVEPNKQMGSIIIFCSKQTKNQAEEEFKQFIESTRKELELETKTENYHNIKKLVFQKGGSIKELLNKEDYRVTNLNNIPIDTTDQELREFIEEYADLEKLEVRKDSRTNTKTATLTFCSSKDLQWVVNELNYSEFGDKVITFENPDNIAQVKRLTAQSIIKFKWFAWPLTKKGAGTIVFKTNVEANNAGEIFTQKFDEKQVSACVESNILRLEGLNERSDQIYLKSRLSVFGEILDIQLEKQFLQEPKSFQSMLEYCIKQYTSPNQRFQIEYLNKMSDGLRVAKILIYDPLSVTKLCNALNQIPNLMGKTRLYLQPQHTHPIVIPDRRVEKLYLSILNESIEELKIENKVFRITVQSLNQKYYIVLKSTNLDALNLVIGTLNKNLQQISIPLNSKQKEIFFSHMGTEILNRVEAKYDCKFIASELEKKLGVICWKQRYDDIYSELLNVSQTVLDDTVTCSLKTYKHLCKNLNKLEQIKQKHQLDNINIDHVGKSIFIKGLPLSIKNARTTLLFYLESIHGQASEAGSPDACAICCEEMTRPYRLQLCGHTFCEECLMFSVNNAFADMSCFPIKCPHCLGLVAIRDLNSILDTKGWAKLTQMSINDFVNKHNDQYVFCYTANCKGLFQTKYTHRTCQICQKSYCPHCKTEQHKGLTCQQVKDGSGALLKKYMQQNDVRVCPNTACKMLMQRIDGCYRVTCSKCNHSICWKCPKHQMKVFETANECYQHLTQAHEGYW